MKLMGLASTASLMSSCGVERTTEHLIPFVVPPEEDYIPGEDYYYNSTCTECPANCGISVKVREFNPIKLEGIENHPINNGALCLRGQSSLMRLYHPERIKAPLVRNSSGTFEATTWENAYTQIIKSLRDSEQNKKRSLYLSGRTTGSLSDLINEFCKTAKVERLPEYETFSYSNLREANNIIFGKPEIPNYNIDKSDLLITIGADIIETFISPVQLTVRLNKAKKQETFHWTHVDPEASLSGFQASEKIRIKPGSESYLLLFLLNFILKSNLQKNRIPNNILAVLPQVSVSEVESQTGIGNQILNDMAQALAKASSPLVISGGVSTTQSGGLEVAALTALLQWATGMATDGLVDFSKAENYRDVGSILDMLNLVNRLKSNEVGVIFISNTNPLSTMPDETGLEQYLEKATLRVAFSDFHNSTTEKCDLILPLSHTLESWGDAEPRDGLVNVIQPTIDPIFDTRSIGDILLGLLHADGKAQSSANYQEWLFAAWNTKHGSAFADQFLEKGYLETTPAKVNLSLQADRIAEFIRSAKFANVLSEPVIYVKPSLRTFDGRSAILPLSQEVPDPLTTVTYGGWASISKESARELGVKDRDELRFETEDASFDLPVRIQPGLAKNVFTVYRDHIDSKLLKIDSRSGEAITALTGFSITRTGKSVALPFLAGKMDQEDREIIPDHYDDHEMEHHHEVKASLYPEEEYANYRWSMSIDLESCIGCSACVAACYVENNIPVVGPEQHLQGREMSWIRVQPYYNQKEEAEFLIMLCQQCGNAPCETVCPVYATYHNPEGLNAMVYNRCVGTRYCHNNCPYKVRRFNWFQHEWPEPMNRMQNPDVFVRGRGVMEKCTFCVQRIRKAKDVAKDEGRKVRDGEVTPACAQTCPTDAIVFGNLLDKESEVYKKSQSDREFRVLELLGTLPAVHYLRKGKETNES
jgi:anaerobic selenocysteine-containing dehydrogenase/Fe-S-cluster-containing dehydrogenase component